MSPKQTQEKQIIEKITNSKSHKANEYSNMVTLQNMNIHTSKPNFDFRNNINLNLDNYNFKENNISYNGLLNSYGSYGNRNRNLYTNVNTNNNLVTGVSGSSVPFNNLGTILENMENIETNEK